MKERPILFSGPMVRAILDGRKTQTRRVVKPQPNQRWNHIGDVAFCTGDHCRSNGCQGDTFLTCPYGKPGDRLWVKETWCAWDTYMENVECDEVVGNAKHLREMGITRHHITYRADPERHAGKWRPSIFMPRWASRLTLEIVRVRVERLQDISEEDAKSEGLFPNPKYDHAQLWTWDGVGGNSSNPIYAYQMLWEIINGPGSWAANPWVWVIEFKKL